MPSSPKPVRSMTGYALTRAQTSVGELTVSLRSVNHRGLDLHFHHGADLAAFENALRNVLKQSIGRGHVEVRTSLNRDGAAGSPGCNTQLLARYVQLFQQFSRDLGLDGKPDLNALLMLPGVLENGREAAALPESFEAELESAMTQCVQQLNQYREREGRELLEALESETDALEKQSAEIAAIRSGAVTHFQDRLRERLQALLGDSGISEARLVEEAAVLADKSDIQEELTRLSAHSGELRRILEAGGEVGKRLDFLLQEMNRETNTMLSKTSGIGETGLTITGLGLAIKANIERMREQALNLE